MADSSHWKEEESFTNLTLSTSCGDSKVIVSIDKLAASDGKIYSFLLIPVGSADIFDQPYEGLDVFVRYPGKRHLCSTKDLSLILGAVPVRPASAVDASEQHASCSYHFEPTLQDSGDMLFQFHNSEFCSIPELKIRFKTEMKHHYDSIQG
jgi:hypothetical protein